MLHLRSLTSSDPRFKTVSFRAGLNVVLADREERSSDTDTRNGAGKTSIVELLHFLLAGDWSRTREPQLRGTTFSLDFDLAGARVVVERTGQRPGRVRFRQIRDTSLWPVQPERDGDGGVSLSVEDWGAVLGALVFGLKLPTQGEQYRPSFRNLFSYFVRRARDGGYLDPQSIHRHQALWDKQVCISFLLGLDWTIPQAMEGIRAKSRLRQQIRKMMAEDDGLELREVLPNSAELRTRLTLAESKLSALRTSVASFRVAAQYHDFETEVDKATSELASLADANTVDRQQVTELEQSLALEAPPDSTRLEEVYREAGLLLPPNVLQRFEDVRAFHGSVIANRRAYLQGELLAARARIASRESRSQVLDQRRSDLLQILRTHGALDSFTRLTEELGKLEGLTQHLRLQYERAMRFESTGRELVVEESQLASRLAQNQADQAEQIGRATVVFAELSERLYSTPGRLIVNNRLTGPPIAIRIPRADSEGIMSMQIFCFDMALAQLAAERSIGPQCLVHDSHVFDGVDVRQIRQGLSVASEQAMALKIQHIAMLNTDIASEVEREGFELQQYVIEPRLSDQPDGGLFGFQFGEEETPVQTTRGRRWRVRQ